MDGFPLSSFSSFSQLAPDLSSSDLPESIMENMVKTKDQEWLPLIEMKEELINHMKEDVIIPPSDGTSPVDRSLDDLSTRIIQFMKDFNEQRARMDKAEKKMKQVIEETQKDIQVITTFIEFLSKISNQTDKDMEPIQVQINLICKDIQNTSKMNEMKNTYLLEKNKFHKHLNIIKLLNQMNVGSTCSICLQDNVDSYFNPCGHTACSNCCTQNSDFNEHKCPLCRGYIRDIHKLYFT